MPLGDSVSSLRGHSLFFCTVPSANTVVRWVNENAFVLEVQTRPCPTFGRPVHLGSYPIAYGPVLLLMPFRFHLTVDTLPSEVQQVVALGRSWKYPAFAFVPV
jgi:hypothetical protein